MASRVALITGCSSWIGMETALRLASRPKDPLLVYATMRNLASRERLDQRAGKLLNESLFVRELDVTKEDTIADVVSYIKSTHGRIDVVVNNAGIAGPCILEATPLDTFRRLFETNFFGAVRVTQEVLPLMKEQRSGKFINISSIAGIVGFPFYELYGSSKFALEGFSESLAMICRRYNIGVSLIELGTTSTEVEHNPDISDSLLAQADDQRIDGKTREYFIDRLEQRRRSLLLGAQPVERVVDIVDEIVDAEKPHLRYQTSDVAEGMAQERFKDPTGDKWVRSFDEGNEPHLDFDANIPPNMR